MSSHMRYVVAKFVWISYVLLCRPLVLLQDVYKCNTSYYIFTHIVTLLLHSSRVYIFSFIAHIPVLNNSQCYRHMPNNMHYTYTVYKTYRRCDVWEKCEDIETICIMYVVSPKRNWTFETARQWAGAGCLRRWCCVAGTSNFIFTLATSCHFN